jgi:Uma2 family endonuclease
MPSTKPRALIACIYEEYAREYLKGLPLEHFMEAIAQATQRKITLESFDLVKPHRPDLHVYSELLVQYPRRGQERPGQVVPDNMVVRSDEEPKAELSYSVPIEPAPPFWVMEYVSQGNKRKDYVENMRKYERELNVPYYLLFNAEAQEMILYHYKGKKYVSVKPNKHGRYAVPELDMEVGMLDGWVRFWYKGRLLPLPADLQRQLDDALGRAEDEKRRADEEKNRAEGEKRRADEEKNRADEQKQRAEELQGKLADAEEETARLRALLEKRNHKGRP